MDKNTTINLTMAALTIDDDVNQHNNEIDDNGNGPYNSDESTNTTIK